MKKATALKTNGHYVVRRSAKLNENGDTLRVGRDKIIRVFRYLEALNQHRNPVQRQLSGQQWSLWLHDLPDHASTQRGVVSRETARAAKDGDVHNIDRGENFVFKVRRPKLSSPPDPPREVAAWLKDGWDDPGKKAAFHETRKDSEHQDQDSREKFDDVPSRLSAFQRWQSERDAWAASEKPARAAMKIFAMLDDLHARLQREGEQLELILADGILSWRVARGQPYHPIPLHRLDPQFKYALSAL